MIALFFVGVFILSIILNLVRIGRNIRAKYKAKEKTVHYEQSLEYKKFEKELNDMINQSYN